MLSKNARLILNIAKKADEQKCAYLSLTKQLNWEFNAVYSACSQLINAGLASERDQTHPSTRQSVAWGIVLTEEGRNSGIYLLARIGNFLFRSVAVPIFVAFVTALITAYLTTRAITLP